MRTTCSKTSYTHVPVISAYFESKLPRSRTSKLTRIQNIRIIMNYQTVRLVSTFGPGSCVSSFGSSPKWKLRPFPVLGLPKGGNCGRVSSFRPFPPLGLHSAFINFDELTKNVVYLVYICRQPIFIQQHREKLVHCVEEKECRQPSKGTE